MKKSRVAFNLLDRYNNAPVDYKEITCHLIFDVKMDPTKKSWYVAGGHLTNPPSSMSYARVVSRDTVRLALLIAAFNYLHVLAWDIQNAYLNAPTNYETFSTLVMNGNMTNGKLLLFLDISMV